MTRGIKLLGVVFCLLLGFSVGGFSDSAASFGFISQNGGTPQGAATTLNCDNSTTTCTNSGGVVTVAAISGASGINQLSGDVTAGPGSGKQTATVAGLKSVPFCTGYTPTNNQVVTYTTASSPNPCYTAGTPATGGSASFGAFASLPGSATSGATYYTTDSPYMFVGNGSAWTAFIGANNTVTVPTVSFSWANQGGATVTTTHGGEILTAPSNSGDSFRTRITSVPSTPWSIQIAYKMSPWNANFFGSGIIMYDSVGGRGVVCGVGTQSGGIQALQTQHLTTLTSVSSNPFQGGYIPGDGLIWIKMFNDGTTLHCYESTTSGVTWNQYFSESATTWVTTPTSVGYTYDINNTTVSGTFWLLHWLQGTS